ncbi:hypothetical protein DEO72_LG9g2871 [Vigna unguiculata]|uniref:Uncharacterized protein n=1 Tax=Vigna unguiculata TaxID=3917 RepID=A0A4D6N4N6_VIGUN|nr:hypothetical protein DEO72_LG9g2871 [Vigna unguiculata]
MNDGNFEVVFHHGGRGDEVVDDSSRSGGEIEGAFRTLKWRLERYLSAIDNERRNVFEAFLLSMLSFLLPLSQYYFIGLSPMICDSDGVEYVGYKVRHIVVAMNDGNFEVVFHHGGRRHTITETQVTQSHQGQAVQPIESQPTQLVEAQQVTQSQLTGSAPILPSKPQQGTQTPIQSQPTQISSCNVSDPPTRPTFREKISYKRGPISKQ